MPGKYTDAEKQKLIERMEAHINSMEHTLMLVKLLHTCLMRAEGDDEDYDKLTALLAEWDARDKEDEA